MLCYQYFCVFIVNLDHEDKLDAMVFQLDSQDYYIVFEFACQYHNFVSLFDVDTSRICSGIFTASILVSVKSTRIQHSSDLETEERLEKCCEPRGVFCQIRVGLVSSKRGTFKRSMEKKSEPKTFEGAVQTLRATEARDKQCAEISGKITSLTGNRKQHALQSVQTKSGSSEAKTAPSTAVESSEDEGQDVILESSISKLAEGMNVNTFTCHLCSKPFGTDENLQKHMKTTHNMKPHQCAKCGETCESNENLRKHKHAE